MSNTHYVQRAEQTAVCNTKMAHIEQLCKTLPQLNTSGSTTERLMILKWMCQHMSLEEKEQVFQAVSGDNLFENRMLRIRLGLPVQPWFGSSSQISQPEGRCL